MGQGWRRPPPRARRPPRPVALCWCGRLGAQSPPHAGRWLRGPRAPRWGPRPGAALRPSSRPHGDSRVLPLRHGAGWPAALGRLGLSLALQRRGGGGEGRLPAWGSWCLHPWREPRCPASLLSQGCPPASARHSGAGPHAPLPLPAQGRAGKEGHRPGRARVRSQGAGLGEAAEPQWPGGGALARCPSPAACPTGVRAPPGPAPAAGQTSRRHACWLGPRPSHVPPARTETGVGDFTEGIYCSELSCSQLFDGGTRGGSVRFRDVCVSEYKRGRLTRVLLPGPRLWRGPSHGDRVAFAVIGVSFFVMY